MEYEAWKGREIDRIKRYRRNMKDEEEERGETPSTAQYKTKRRFMQKHYIP